MVSSNVCWSFSSSLQDSISGRKTERRLDVLVIILFEIRKDVAFSRFIKINKGKSTHRINEVNKRHKRAEKMLEKNIRYPCQIKVGMHLLKTWTQCIQLNKMKKIARAANSFVQTVRLAYTPIHVYMHAWIHLPVCKHAFGTNESNQSNYCTSTIDEQFHYFATVLNSSPTSYKKSNEKNFTKY